MKTDCYYKNCCTTVTLPRVLDKIRDCQGEEFPVRVKLTFLDDNGNVQCKSGVITGVLDNGDEVYIDAETIEYIRKKNNEKDY